MTAHTPKTWLITGCSTGIGRALAQRVLEHGDRCVATARNPAGLESLAKSFPKTARVAALDVTDAAARDAAVALAESAFGGVDVLVNNAGYGYLGAIEEGDEADVRTMFDTNVFALAAMTKCVLPAMRARRSGTIVNLSSVGGLVANPGSGYYSATKFAIEGISQALAKEVEPLGIHVLVIEPGPFRTDFHGRSVHSAKVTIDDYASTVGARRKQLLAANGRQPGDPMRAADAIIRAVESPRPPQHLLLGAIAAQRVRERYAAFLASMDEWEEVTRSADFPEGGMDTAIPKAASPAR